MRGTAPDRARPDYLRPGSFKPGHKKSGGRRRGAPNLISLDYRKAIVEAAYRIGYDGNGKDGVIGYFAWLADYHEDIFWTELAVSLLPLEAGESTTSAPAKPSQDTKDPDEKITDPWTLSLLEYFNRLCPPDQTETEASRRTLEEWDQWARDFIGLTGKNRAKGKTVQVDCASPWAWTGQAFPVGSLMNLAVTDPKAFCSVFIAAFLRPPTKRRRPATGKSHYAH